MGAASHGSGWWVRVPEMAVLCEASVCLHPEVFDGCRCRRADANTVDAVEKLVVRFALKVLYDQLSVCPLSDHHQ